jgi:hypothetical protein
LLLVETPYGRFHFTMRNKDFDHTKSGTPSFVYMEDAQRTSLIKHIYDYGNTGSRIVSRFIGINPHQVGAVRRWHVGDWRLRNSKI